MNQPVMKQHIVEVTLANARQVLIEESMKRLVVVDFWADWCAPCKALMPVLEKLAAEYDGQFLLAKVNADKEPDIAGQFGIRSLPTVILMRDGQPVDAFRVPSPRRRCAGFWRNTFRNPGWRWSIRPRS